MKTQTTLIVLAGMMAVLAASRLPAAAADTNLPVVIPPASEILSRVKKEHPRLLATAKDFAQLKERVKSDAQLQQWHGRLREQAAEILKEPPSKYEIPDGLRLLGTSRRVLHRVQTLALLYQLDGDKRYVERAWKELEAAANFKDWNPRHFLDTAEMTHAFAIGYDWLYDQWTDEQRATLRTAMVEKGIKPAQDIQSRNTWWARSHHNWNQVCNGGIGMGALALADVEPQLAGEVLRAALQSIQLAMTEFAPDGAWAEGPGYWNYATRYNVAFLAALQSALGTDFGLSRMAGFPETSLFPIYISSPTGETCNFADGGSHSLRAPQLFWLAREFNQPVAAWFQQRAAAPEALDLLWYQPKATSPKAAALPLDKYFRNVEVAIFRGAWEDPKATFIGFKAGDNKANHSHLDLGTFVLDALGVRWAIDLGREDYNLPGYFGSQRWTYYRLRAEGHNTLVLNPSAGPDQDPKAKARIVRFDSQPKRAFAIADLTAAYAGNAAKVQRGMALQNRRQALVQDEIEADKPADVWWFMHTEAAVKLSKDGSSAVLTKGKAKLRARIVSPKTAAFTVMKAVPLPGSPNPEGQEKNAAIRKLAIHQPGVNSLRLTVTFEPLAGNETVPSRLPDVSPLAAW